MSLPKPFLDDPWRGPRREAAHALWRWHETLWTPDRPELLADADFAEQAARAERGEPVALVPEEVSRAAYAACKAQGLPLAHLAAQVPAAARLHAPVRFETSGDLKEWMEAFVMPHARLLAHLGDAAHTWQVPFVDELAAGFFFTGRLANLPADLALDRLFIPEAELEKAGVSLQDLKAGNVTEPVRKLLWRETVRARDALARGLPLVNEVSAKQAGAIKRWWTGALEVLHQIESNGYDVWRNPVRLTRLNRLQIQFQARFSRATFRPR